MWCGKRRGYGCQELGEWWNLQDNRFIPLMQAAPDSLLKIIHCNCSTACTTLRWSYGRHGLEPMYVLHYVLLEECENPHHRFLQEELKDYDE